MAMAVAVASVESVTEAQGFASLKLEPFWLYIQERLPTLWEASS